MITKEEFVKILTKYQKFCKGVDNLFTVLTGNKYYGECDWIEAAIIMFETTIHSHFTENGVDWIFYYLYEDIEDKRVIVTLEADMFYEKRTREYHINTVDELWNFLMTDKKHILKMQNDLFSPPKEIIPSEKTWHLISRDTKGKIRIAIINYELINPKSPQNRYFIIHRISGQLGGKRTNQPDKIVERGKSVRNLWEQVMLEAKHLVKEKLDKGYREIEKDPNEYTTSELEEILGGIITGQNGVPKVMLAKQVDKVTNTKIFDKEWYASRKIDGLRALIYMGDDGNLHTSSRGAMNYDAAMSDILEHPNLINLFKENPGLIMDGECYHHGWTLQQLNSVARTQKTAVDYSVLQFYWYDIVDTNSTFEERFAFIRDIQDQLNLTFEPEREFKDEELRIQFVPQIPVTGYNNMLKLHNDYVAEGWEGLVVRDPDKVYRPNGRTNDMIKIKCYKSEEFLITGYELGLRGNEDMVFLLETKEGKSFKAKPHGDRSQKDWYIENFDSECLNHYATVKYFYMSDDNIPLQPSVSNIRIEEDVPV